MSKNIIRQLNNKELWDATHRTIDFEKNFIKDIFEFQESRMATFGKKVSEIHSLLPAYYQRKFYFSFLEQYFRDKKARNMEPLDSGVFQSLQIINEHIETFSKETNSTGALISTEEDNSKGKGMLKAWFMVLLSKYDFKKQNQDMVSILATIYNRQANGHRYRSCDIPKPWKNTIEWPFIPGVTPLSLPYLSVSDGVLVLSSGEVKEVGRSKTMVTPGEVRATLKRYESLVTEVCPEGLLPKHNITFVSDIIQAINTNVSLASNDNIEQVVSFLYSWASDIVTASKEEEKKRYLLFNQMDPSVVFPFLRNKSPVDVESLPKSAAICLEKLNESCPFREAENQYLLRSIFRRLIGDTNATYPLLIGGPGTGKSEIARRTGEALTHAGIRTKVVFKSMTQKNGIVNSNSIESFLLGTDSHWANSDAGKIFKTCSANDVDLCLVILDEAEKHDNCYELLLHLLDPKQPLQDAWVTHITDQCDLRHKTIFILSANDERPLNNGPNDPLWSRLRSIYFPQYNKAQLTALLALLAEREYGQIYSLQKEDYVAMANDLVQLHGTKMSFRSYLDLIGEKGMDELLPLDAGIAKKRMDPPEPQRMGF